MIVVKVELHSAITGKVEEIGRMHICNTGAGTTKSGDYHVALLRRGTLSKVQREGSVQGHARNSLSVWSLVAKALASVGFGAKVDP